MFAILFVGDLFSGLGVIPQIAPDVGLLAVQALLLAFSIYSVTRAGAALQLPALAPMVLLLGATVLSAIVQGQGAAELTVFTWAMVGQYVVLVALVNLPLSGEWFKRVNRVIFALCAIQIPAAFYRMITGGSDVFLAGGSRSFGTESAVGTLGRAAGSLGTTFPLIVIGFLFAFYLWRQKKIYVLWMLGFILFSFFTGKRAFPLFLPVFLITLYFLIRGSSAVISRRLATVTMVGAVGLLGGLFLPPSLNPSGTIGGKIDLRYAWEKVTDYETQETWDGKQSGRLSTTVHLWAIAQDRGPMTLLLGHGPATLIKSGLIESKYDTKLESLEVAYGVTGAAWLFVQTGLIGLLFYILIFVKFFRRALRMHKRLINPYWRSICGGLIGFHLVIFFDMAGYSTSVVSGKLLPALYWYFLAQVLLVHRREIANRQLDTSPA
jgi:hypothetical protein